MDKKDKVMDKSKLEWKFATGRELGYATGDKITAYLSFDFALLTVCYDPYDEYDNTEDGMFFAELDFEDGKSEVSEGATASGAIKRVVEGYIWYESLPEISDDIEDILIFGEE